MSHDLFTRRSALRAGLVAGTSVLAGCFDGTSPENSSSSDPPATSTISNIAVDGAYLVVDWREDRTVSAANLIGPDGQTFAETDVPAGETTTEIRLLDIDPGVGGYDHYDPGQYELVAVTDDGQDSMAVALEPDLQITDVQQYRDGDSPSDLGKLAVTVENVGTGPTWIYDITYRNAPNPSANDDLVPDPGVPQLELPADPSLALIGPGTQQAFVSTSTPILFSDGGNGSCQIETSITIIAGKATGNALERQVNVAISGGEEPVGLVDDFTCSNISVEFGISSDMDG